ncbi:MAG: pilus assembly protein [Verrucomicrobiae bacterium]|nr:pilus assembly protein [Verrucomicrobiae bacterium]
MEKPLHNGGLLRDERAVALTEFAIVMPVVLLFFLVMLQYFAALRAAQLGNYAAYVAARSYAVRHSQPDALTAAAMALAPTAKFVPGEAGGGGGSGILSQVMGDKAGDYAAGLAAAYVRLQGNAFSAKKDPINGSSLQQASVVINYPQPIYAPGLKPLWNMLAGPDINTKLAPLAGGGWFGFLNSIPYVNIQSRCATGYETWGEDSAYNDAAKKVKTYSVWDPNDWGSGSHWQPREARQ